MQVACQIGHNVFCIQAAEKTLSHVLDQRVSQGDNASHDQSSLSVVLAFAAVRARTSAENAICADEVWLEGPGALILVEVAEEDMHAVGTSKSVFLCSDVRDPFCVFSIGGQAAQLVSFYRR